MRVDGLAAAGWRPMTAVDLADVDAIAGHVHLGFPERPVVFSERLALFPAGCLILEKDGEPAGYVLSHPWIAVSPPPLDSLLGQLPRVPSTYYLHDIALLPHARGGGAATALLSYLDVQAVAAGCAGLSLVAVNGSMPFWARNGFVAVDTPPLKAKLASYGADACFMARDLAPPAT